VISQFSLEASVDWDSDGAGSFPNYLSFPAVSSYRVEIVVSINVIGGGLGIIVWSGCGSL